MSGTSKPTESAGPFYDLAAFLQAVFGVQMSARTPIFC